MRSVLRVATALAPLAITPLLLFAIGDGYLNFGGGEKEGVVAVVFAVLLALSVAGVAGH